MEEINNANLPEPSQSSDVAPAQPSEIDTAAATDPVIIKKKKKYKGFSFKQRLPLVLLLSLILPITIFLIGPIEIYYGNRTEFGFQLWDFFGWNILFAFLLFSALTAILLPLRKRVFDVVYGLVFWLSLMSVVQGNYLNFGINSLSGDGLGDAQPQTSVLVINIAIWIIVGVACVLAMLLIKKKKHRSTKCTVACIICITIIGMQVIPCAMNIMVSASEQSSAQTSTDGSSAEEPTQYFLTYENIDKASYGKNIIYFVIDRFDPRYYEQARKDAPELFYNLDNGGFTYFDDAISLYPRTYPSITYMVTGVEQDFSLKKSDYFKKAYTTSPFLNSLHNGGYTVNIYTDTFYGYENADDMRGYISNYDGSTEYTVNNPLLLCRDMLRLSLYRYLPIFAKDMVGSISTPDFKKHVTYASDSPVYSTDLRDMHNFLDENPITIDTNEEKSFSFIHLAGTHLPNLYDENFEPLSKDDDRRGDAVVAMKQNFKIINQYIDQLKTLGVYEDCTIIITGDHPSIGSDTKVPLLYPHVTPLFIKPSGSSSSALEISHAQVCHADIFATILDEASIKNNTGLGENLFDIPEDEERVRTYFFQSLQKPDGRVNYESVTFKITGSAKDYDNWEIVDRRYIGNIYN